MIVHQVFFWLKSPNKDFESVIGGCRSLGKIQSARDTLVGLPASTPKRDVVDNSYDIALNVTFESIADHDHYQVDPIHLRFIADHKEKWARVRVFDFEVDIPGTLDYGRFL